MNERPEVERFKTLTKLFSTLDVKGVERLASIAATQAFKPNDTIVKTGAPADCFYVVVQGGVRVVAAGGFSSMTCLPARSAIRAASKCACGGVQMEMQSRSGTPASIVAMSGKFATPSTFALRLAQATS